MYFPSSLSHFLLASRSTEIDFAENRLYPILVGLSPLAATESSPYFIRDQSNNLSGMTYMRKRHSISHIESGMTHIDAFIRYIRNYALAYHASMGICHYAFEISN